MVPEMEHGTALVAMEPRVFHTFVLDVVSQAIFVLVLLRTRRARVEVCNIYFG